MKALFSKIVISGVGLLGGSVAKASQKNHLAEEVIGVCRSESGRDRIEASGAVDRAVLSFKDALTDSERNFQNHEIKPVLIVVAVPVNSIVEELEKAVQIIETFDTNHFFLLTDVGSTKTQIVESIRQRVLPNNAVFIGSHPIAGSEKTGVEAALDSLFEGRRTVITLEKTQVPPRRNQNATDADSENRNDRSAESESRRNGSDCNEDPEAGEGITSKTRRGLDLLRTFWESLGSQVIEMTPEDHDRILARTSHLPQLLSSALSYLVSNEEHFLCGTGFSGMTRLAGSSPVMWNDIFKANRASVTDALDAYIEILHCWKIALQREDDSERLALLKEAKKKRDALGS